MLHFAFCWLLAGSWKTTTAPNDNDYTIYHTSNFDFREMAPKLKTKKAKGETEEEKLIREEDERKQRDAEAKRIADEAERLRAENSKIQSERRAFRISELAHLEAENVILLDKLSDLDSRMIAEIAHEVNFLYISNRSYFQQKRSHQFTNPKMVVAFRLRPLRKIGLSTEILLRSQMRGVRET